MPRYLTKSRFLLGLDCPAKLFYTGKDLYANRSSDNEFLEALARGGFRVGALAKCYYPEGHEIEPLDPETALQKTEQMMQQREVTLFEAAIRHHRFLIRIDILEKRGNQVNLIEVQSKSFSGTSSGDLLNKSGYIDSDWKPHVYDVAFQNYVLSLARPGWEVHAFLMLADKNKVATVEGLNQRFLLREQAGDRTFVEYVGNVRREALGEELLTRVNVDDLCEKVYHRTDSPDPLPQPLGEYACELGEANARAGFNSSGVL